MEITNLVRHLSLGESQTIQRGEADAIRIKGWIADNTREKGRGYTDQAVTEVGGLPTLQKGKAEAIWIKA